MRADDTTEAHHHRDRRPCRGARRGGGRWPDVGSRRELLLRLVEEGRRIIERERGDAAERRRDAIRRTSGARTGAYEPGYQRLRDDWPA
jgi:hypothetical protein